MGDFRWCFWGYNPCIFATRGFKFKSCCLCTVITPAKESPGFDDYADIRRSKLWQHMFPRKELESLAHVLEPCPFGEVLRNYRHHRIRSMIAQSMREKWLSVYEELFGLVDKGSSQRIDIIAFKPSETNKNCTILDPTVRFKNSYWATNRSGHRKTSYTYEPTIDYYKTKYQLDSICVIGLMLGARGIIPKFLSNFCSLTGLYK